MIRRLWPKSFAGKVLAFFSVAALIGIAAVFLVDRKAVGEIAAHRDWLRAEGFPGSSDELVAALSVHVAEDAAPHLLQAMKLAPQIQSAVEASLANQPEQIRFGADRLAHPVRLAAYVAAVEAAGQFEAALATAGAARSYRATAAATSSPLDFHPGPFKSIRAVGHLEAARCRASLAAGDGDPAVRRMLRFLRLLQKAVMAEPWGGVDTSGVPACGDALAELNRAMRLAPLSAAVRAELETTLAETEVLPQALKRSWSHYMACVERLEFESVPLFRRWPLSALAKADVAAGMAAVRDCMAIADRDHRRFHGEFVAIASGVRSPFPYPVSPRVIGLAGFDQYHAAVCRSLAVARSLRVLNALQAKGDMTVPLERLDLPPAALVDPFDGGALRFRQSPRGVAVYSVGLNFTDDGANPEKDLDVGSFPLDPDPGVPAALAPPLPLSWEAP